MLFDVIVPLVHVIACVFLIVVVLLQTGRGADMGAVFGGGGGQTLFGASGAGNLLTKLTTAMAVTFMLTSLTLAVARQERPGSDLLERIPDAGVPVPPPPAAPAPTPDAPAEPTAAAPTAEESLALTPKPEADTPVGGEAAPSTTDAAATADNAVGAPGDGDPSPD